MLHWFRLFSDSTPHGDPRRPRGARPNLEPFPGLPGRSLTPRASTEGERATYTARDGTLAVKNRARPFRPLDSGQRIPGFLSGNSNQTHPALAAWIFVGAIAPQSSLLLFSSHLTHTPRMSLSHARSPSLSSSDLDRSEADLPLPASALPDPSIIAVLDESRQQLLSVFSVISRELWDEAARYSYTRAESEGRLRTHRSLSAELRAARETIADLQGQVSSLQERLAALPVRAVYADDIFVAGSSTSVPALLRHLGLPHLVDEDEDEEVVYTPSPRSE